MPVDWSKYPEKFWHCCLRLQGSDEDSIVNDLTIQQIRQQIVEPWHQDRSFNISGTIVDKRSQVSELQLVQTNEPHRYFEDMWRARQRASSVFVAGHNTRRDPFKPENCTDYTHELLFAEGAIAPQPMEVTTETPLAPPAPKAFIVHGHDAASLQEVARFLAQLDIQPIILMEEAHKGRTLIEKLEQDTDVQYAIILCTPDDLGRAKDESELKPRARQNVILELGYFISALGRSRICVLNTQGVDMPTDVHGVGYHDLDAAGAWKMKLAQEMKAAGLPVDFNKVL